MMSKSNVVLISGFPLGLSQWEIDSIVAAFKENEGHCTLSGIAILDRKLGLNLKFEKLIIAEEVTRKYDQTLFLGYPINASLCKSTSDVDYRIPSPPFNVPSPPKTFYSRQKNFNNKITINKAERKTLYTYESEEYKNQRKHTNPKFNNNDKSRNQNIDIFATLNKDSSLEKMTKSSFSPNKSPSPPNKSPSSLNKSPFTPRQITVNNGTSDQSSDFELNPSQEKEIISKNKFRPIKMKENKCNTDYVKSKATPSVCNAFPENRQQKESFLSAVNSSGFWKMPPSRNKKSYVKEIPFKNSQDNRPPKKRKFTEYACEFNRPNYQGFRGWRKRTLNSNDVDFQKNTNGKKMTSLNIKTNESVSSADSQSDSSEDDTNNSKTLKPLPNDTVVNSQQKSSSDVCKFSNPGVLCEKSQKDDNLLIASNNSAKTNLLIVKDSQKPTLNEDSAIPCKSQEENCSSSKSSTASDTSTHAKESLNDFLENFSDKSFSSEEADTYHDSNNNINKSIQSEKNLQKDCHLTQTMIPDDRNEKSDMMKLSHLFAQQHQNKEKCNEIENEMIVLFKSKSKDLDDKDIKSFKTDCESVKCTIKVLIGKNPDLELRLVHSYKEIIFELASTLFTKK